MHKKKPHKNRASRRVATSLTLLIVAMNQQNGLFETARVEAETRNEISEMLEQDHQPDQIIVRYDEDASKKDITDIRAESEVVKIETLPIEEANVEMVQVEADQTIEDALVELNKDPDVLYAEPNYIFHIAATPNDTNFSSQWGLHNTGQIIQGQTGVADTDIDAPEAWDIAAAGAPAVVAVIDTGVEVVHTDLNDNLWINTGETASNGIDDDGNGYIDDINGWDFKNNDNSLYDGLSEDLHGTHVAGVIAAETNNNNEVAGTANNKARIMVLKALDGISGGTTSDIIEAINYAKSFSVRVSNNSYGSYSYSQAFMDAIRNSNMLFVAAAGNDGVNNDSSPFYPASYDLDTVISVAALTNKNKLASFSNYGSNTVDLAAPGQNVYSTYPTSWHAYLSGTSMASPFVAGAGGLLLARNPMLTPLQLKRTLLKTADAASDLLAKVRTGGRVNLLAALNATTLVPTSLYESESQSRDVGSVINDPGASGSSAARARTSTSSAGYLQTTPTIVSTAGNYIASFRLKVSSSSSNSTVATAEVAGLGGTISSVLIRGADFIQNNMYQTFQVPFTLTGADTVSLKVYFHDVTDLYADVVSLTKRFEKTYEAESLGHEIGQSIVDLDAENGTAWQATVSGATPGYLQYGPYTTEVPPGTYEARFRIKVSDVTAGSIAKLSVDSHDGSTKHVERIIRGTDFTANNVYQSIPIRFTRTADGTLQFVIYYYDAVDVTVDSVKAVEQWDTMFQSEALGHLTGSRISDADATNGAAWRSTTSADAPGYMQYGPYTNDLETGEYTALFRMKTGSAGLSTPVATISAYSHDGTTPFVERTVRGTEFAQTGVYQDIALPFRRVQDGTLQFVVFFTDTADLTVDEVRVVKEWSTTYEAESLAHQVGQSISDGAAENGTAWQATVSGDNPGYMQYGPYTTDILPGSYEALFRVKVGNNTAGTVAKFSVDSHDGSTKHVEQTIRGTDFTAANTYQTIAIPFVRAPNGTIQFVIYYTDAADLTIDSVKVIERWATTFQSEELPHLLGTRVSDVNAVNGAALQATTSSDAPGYMQYGPYTTDMPPGEYTVLFRMKVDSTSQSNIVATLLVSTHNGSTPYVERLVRGTDFAQAGVYQDMSLNYTQTADSTIQFVVYFHDRAGVTLDQVSVVPRGLN